EQRALTHSRSGESRFWETRAGTPAGRLVEPSDVADAVCFLCSPAAEMVRGHTLVVDGGFSLLARLRTPTPTREPGRTPTASCGAAAAGAGCRSRCASDSRTW